MNEAEGGEGDGCQVSLGSRYGWKEKDKVRKDQRGEKRHKRNITQKNERREKRELEMVTIWGERERETPDSSPG